MNTTGSALVDEYIRVFPPEVREMLSVIRLTIREVAPDAEETMKYRMPTFVLNGNLVHFAGYAHHIGFYPTPSGIAEFANALSGYKTSKGAVQFPLDKPLPLPLIRQIVKFRVSENTNRAVKTKR